MSSPRLAAFARRRLHGVPASSVAFAAVALFCLAAAAPLTAHAAVARTVDYDASGQYAFTVPAGVTSISVTAIGAAGGDNCQAPGGDGAKLTATMPVTPGELLHVTVGEAGVDRPCFTGEGASLATLGGGASGGASGSYLAGSAGGGATSLSQPTFAPEPERQPVLVIAGGGGGAAESGNPAKGFGGDAGAAGGAGNDFSYAGEGGQPGGLSAGGAGGTGMPNCIGGGLGDSGVAGASRVGGHGGDFSGVGAGGGGGGGFFGGGGGGAGCRGGGGGGGSSFVAPAGTTVEPAAPSDEAARLTISYLAPSPAATIASVPNPFPPVAQGGVSAPQTVQITNTGEAPLALGGTSFAGNAPGDFLISSSTCGSPVEVGLSCEIQVRFAPQAEGARAATLAIASNDPAGPAQVELSGTGDRLPVGATGPRGETGPQGPAGKVLLITCKRLRGGRGAPKRCTTKRGRASIKFAFRGSKTAAILKRGSTVYAKGFAVRSVAHRTQLVMTPLRTLRPGKYKLVLGRAGKSRHRTIRIVDPRPSSRAANAKRD